MNSRTYLYIMEYMKPQGMTRFKYLSYDETLHYLLLAGQTARRTELDSLEPGDSIEVYRELYTVTLMRHK